MNEREVMSRWEQISLLPADERIWDDDREISDEEFYLSMPKTNPVINDQNYDDWDDRFENENGYSY